MVILRFPGYRSSVHGLPMQRVLPTGVGSCKLFSSSTSVGVV